MGNAGGSFLHPIPVWPFEVRHDGEGYHPSGGARDSLRWTGSVLHGRFRIDALVTDGPHDALYRGTHLKPGTPIAIRCPKTPDGVPEERFIRHVRRESRRHYQLSRAHPHFVRVIASGTAAVAEEPGPRPFVVLEWLEGETLARHVSNRRARGKEGRSLSEVVRLLDGAAEALALAHAHGVVHGALSPQRLFVTRADAKGRASIKLLDFGIASPAMAPRSNAPPDSGRRDIDLAPELRRTDLGVVGPWSDVYALAMILFTMLLDRTPIAEGLEGDDAARLGEHRPTPSALGIEVSPRVSGVLKRAVAMRAAERQKDVGEFWGMLKGAILRDRDSLQRVSKLPLTAASSGASERERSTMPEDLRVTLSRIDGVTVPRVDPDVIALSNAEISYADALPLNSGVRSAPAAHERERGDAMDRPSNDTVVMTPSELETLYGGDDALDRGSNTTIQRVDDEGLPAPRVPPKIEPAPPSFPRVAAQAAAATAPSTSKLAVSDAKSGADGRPALAPESVSLASPLAPMPSPLAPLAPEAEPRKSAIGVGITSAFIALAALLCTGLAAAAYLDWL